MRAGQTRKSHAAQYEAIRKHGEALQWIFPATCGLSPVELCKKLRRIEVATSRAAEDACNTQQGADLWERRSESAMRRLDALLRFTDIGVPVIINSDPRGYALKIDNEWMATHNPPLHRDWGGYGILAPEIE